MNHNVNKVKKCYVKHKFYVLKQTHPNLKNLIQGYNIPLILPSSLSKFKANRSWGS